MADTVESPKTLKGPWWLLSEELLLCCSLSRRCSHAMRFGLPWKQCKARGVHLSRIDIACLCAAAFTFERFQAALSVVLAYVAYLPSASCFVLLPLLSQVL